MALVLPVLLVLSAPLREISSAQEARLGRNGRPTIRCRISCQHAPGLVPTLAFAHVRFSLREYKVRPTAVAIDAAGIQRRLYSLTELPFSSSRMIV